MVGRGKDRRGGKREGEGKDKRRGKERKAMEDCRGGEETIRRKVEGDEGNRTG